MKKFFLTMLSVLYAVRRAGLTTLFMGEGKEEGEIIFLGNLCSYRFFFVPLPEIINRLIYLIIAKSD